MAVARLLLSAAVAVVVLGAAPPRAVAAPDGRALYAKYCQLCHGAALEGYAADNAPSLSSPTFRASASTPFLQIAIERGRAGTAMAGFGKSVGGPLEPAEVDALVDFVRGGRAAPPVLPPKASKGDVARGGRLYATHCESCHGTATQRGNAVHLANPMFLASASDAYLRVAVVEGRPGTPMEAWQGKLSTGEIEDVVAYVRSLARPVPAAPVAPPTPAPTIPVVLNPQGAPPAFTLRLGRYASVAEVAAAWAEKRRMVIIDARPTSDYLRMHITGAISVPYFDMRGLDEVPNDGTWVIAYCVCPHEESGRILEELRTRGYPNTAILDEGFFVWATQGHPVEAADGQMPIAAPPAKPAAFTPAPLASPRR
ncbi:MAG: c-type cytochrome [Deltaproteobacteria bacterium]|nr:c-type cytochrome [Deltaproteobacteria bacterium]